MSLVTVESLACGRSVVATDVAGMREAIMDGPLPPAGTVTPDTSSLVQAVQGRLDDELLRVRERCAARDRAELLYSPDALVDRVRSLYAKALGIDLRANEVGLVRDSAA